MCAIVCLVGMGLIGYVANNSLSSSLVELGEVRVPKIIRVAALEQSLRDIQVAVNQSLAWEGAGFKAEKIAALDRSIAAKMAGYDRLLAGVSADLALDAVERSELSTLRGEFAKYRTSATEALDIKTGMLGNAVFYMTTMDGTARHLNTSMTTLIEHERAESAAAVQEARTLARRNRVVIIGGFALSIGAALAIAWLFGRATHAEFSAKNRALAEAQRLAEEASLRDPLTGLRNRRFLEQQLDADISLCLRRHQSWSESPTPAAPFESDLVFFLVDIDHFKQVNDVDGHGAGDKVLAQIRARLQQAFRESDYLVRWGGEEFLVVARESKRADASTLAERIRHAMEGEAFDIGNGVPLARTCSVGFACFPFLPGAPEALGWRQVVELADHGLYIAKHAGRNRCVGLAGDSYSNAAEVVGWLGAATRSTPDVVGLHVLRVAAVHAVLAPAPAGAARDACHSPG